MVVEIYITLVHLLGSSHFGNVTRPSALCEAVEIDRVLSEKRSGDDHYESIYQVSPSLLGGKDKAVLAQSIPSCISRMISEKNGRQQPSTLTKGVFGKDISYLTRVVLMLGESGKIHRALKADTEHSSDSNPG